VNPGEKAYFQALQALCDRDFNAASGFFKLAENQFAENLEFRILSEATDLLLAVKEEIGELEKEEALD
jgi:hypothetical protein